MTARLLTCTPAEYFRDPCETPSLTQSIARTLLTRSPLHAWTEHPRFGDKPRKTNGEMDTGKLVHSMLLDAGADLAVINADNYRTKEAQTQRDAASAAGKLPILAKDYGTLAATVEQIRMSLYAQGIALEGDSEVAIEWREGETLCRGLMDHLIINSRQNTIYDVKTIRSADPQSCSRHAYEYGYDIQAAAYTSAVS